MIETVCHTRKGMLLTAFLCDSSPHNVKVLLLPVFSCEIHTKHCAGPALLIMTCLLSTQELLVLTWRLRLVEDAIIFKHPGQAMYVSLRL